jgi:hypothetical protein
MSKRIILIIALCIAFIQNNFAQTINELFDKTTPITFLGIDFTNTRYIGRTGTVDTTEMIGLLNEMNNFIFTTKKDYNISEALKPKFK